MGVSPDDVAAWALAAMSADELDELDGELDAVAADGADTRRAVRPFLETVAALDHAGAVVPPDDLRRTILDRARSRPRLDTLPTPAIELFRRQVEALGELLDGLDAPDWGRPARPYRWTVHGLVAHLLVIEEYTAGRLGVDRGSPLEGPHLEVGADQIERELASDPPDTAGRWLERARRTLDELGRADLRAAVNLHGWPFSLEGALIARAFEIWTHTDDVRRATGRPVASPRTGDLRTMSSFSISTLSLTYPLVAGGRSMEPVRMVLTGAGGGTFDLGDAAGDVASRTTIVTDVTDYCRAIARRIDVADLACDVDGDHDVARSVLEAAAVFAV